MISDAELNDLLFAVATGERRAFRMLYEKASPKLFGIALKICQDHSVAEDVLQEAFINVWRKAHEFDPDRGEAGAWLSVIVRNRSIDALRQQTRGIVGVTSGANMEMDTTPDTNVPEDGGIDRLALIDCLNRLDERQRDLIIRAYVRGDSRKELSNTFATPINTIKTLLRRGLLNLKKDLKL